MNSTRCGRRYGACVLRGSILIACCASGALLAAGCGEAQRDAKEPKGSYQVEVLSARFPTHQAIARDTALEIAVRNTGTGTIPNVAVTVDSLSYISNYPNLADRRRPTWVINRGPGPSSDPPPESEQVNQPGGGQTTFVNTWALGALAPGAAKTFVWRVTPVVAGTHTISYRVAAGLDGRSVAHTAAGGAPAGRLTVHVAPKPPSTHFNPDTGEVVPGVPSIPAGPLPAAP
jgi:hypothetical protein